jgi:hypothetical protein
MQKQNYQNHVRYYFPHHFVFYPIVCIAMGLSLICSFIYKEQTLIWIAIAGIFGTIAALSFMLRQHYALMNQNRIVKLELRFRYYVLTHQRFEEIEARLSESQLFALRFTSDQEFQDLIKRALKENLSGDEIKKSIKNWNPDYMRV